MLRLLERSAEDCRKHHESNPVRVYDDDAVQSHRVRRCREILKMILKPGMDVVELGCGSGDISGHFSEEHNVLGYDCNKLSIETCLQRFPSGSWQVSDIESIEADNCDAVIMCEVLEHLNDPIAVAAKWMRRVQYALVSHPIDEPLHSNMSGGDHAWSFSFADLHEWPKRAGHSIIHCEIIPNGFYQVGTILTRLDSLP